MVVPPMRCLTSFALTDHGENFQLQIQQPKQVAVSFISDAFGKLIVSNNMRSPNISIGKCGSLSIQTKFETKISSHLR